MKKNLIGIHFGIHVIVGGVSKLITIHSVTVLLNTAAVMVVISVYL